MCYLLKGGDGPKLEPWMHVELPKELCGCSTTIPSLPLWDVELRKPSKSEHQKPKNKI